MKKFNISRINTGFGIFNVIGTYNKNCKELKVSQLYQMGTDGWFELDINRAPSVVEKLEPLIINHIN
ncbi:hypothetical protein L4D04_13410 [Photobacterium angustum]|uniref:Uncharacterized protein n=1 Tax=Photobacterium angustum (strain S14 / CCUG 15956) TaxID=314292 RepID=Q1ZUQ0_PHOAS|nr:hypothetical protein [Photobacterium angustum]EAS66360.1 hypothetical protein VAS14_13624 [Photobacterium angustum S14]